MPIKIGSTMEYKVPPSLRMSLLFQPKMAFTRIIEDFCGQLSLNHQGFELTAVVLPAENRPQTLLLAP